MQVRHPEAQEPSAFLPVNHTCGREQLCSRFLKTMVSSQANNIGQRYEALLDSTSHLQFSVRLWLRK